MEFKGDPRRFEMRTEMADFIERVRVNQQKLTANLKSHYDFIVCGSGSSVRWWRADWPRIRMSTSC
jgi:choline dehydrogenase